MAVIGIVSALAGYAIGTPAGGEKRSAPGLAR
jgi:hypothetical protein